MRFRKQFIKKTPPMNKTDMQNNDPESRAQDEVVISLKGISKKYNLYDNNLDRMKESLHPMRKQYHRDFYALKDINLEVKRGEILGIVGKNGSGKSTLLKVISGILTPTAGAVNVKGNVVPLLELGAGFNPEFTGMENIYFYCSLLGYDRKQTDAIVDDIISFAELGDFVNQPIKTYSSGMKARLAFAVSVNVDPDILILDEVLAVGDDLFRRKCYARMEEFFKGGKTILFVSHNADNVIQICQNVVLLDNGKIIMKGDAKNVVSYYQKLLFAVGNENRKKVLNEINKSASGDKKTNNKYSEKKNIKIYNDIYKPYFIEGFKPKTTIEYKNFEVNFFDMCVKTIDGEIVNHLITGEEYIFEHKTSFGIDARDVSFGIAIKNEKGLDLSKGSMQSRNEFISLITKDSCCLVRWKFTCNLMSGIYYISIGVGTFENNEHVLLNRVVDAYVFKVIKQRNNLEYGIVFLNQFVYYMITD